ncbi:hypothetical protein FB451DRAFT_301447 [Mycena latifolia]|nr:hypothetical protein FB451DRAFT_301447 [Mycena latifolia]
MPPCGGVASVVDQRFRLRMPMPIFGLAWLKAPASIKADIAPPSSLFPYVSLWPRSARLRNSRRLVRNPQSYRAKKLAFCVFSAALGSRNPDIGEHCPAARNPMYHFMARLSPRTSCSAASACKRMETMHRMKMTTDALFFLLQGVSDIALNDCLLLLLMHQSAALMRMGSPLTCSSTTSRAVLAAEELSSRRTRCSRRHSGTSRQSPGKQHRCVAQRHQRCGIVSEHPMPVSPTNGGAHASSRTFINVP